MNPFMFEEKFLKILKIYSKNTGISLVFLGTLSFFINIIFPKLDIKLFIGVLLLLCFFTIISTQILYSFKNRLSIIQSLIPLIASFVFLFLPLKHDLAILTTIVFYLFLDGFIKGAIGVSYRPLKRWRYLAYSGAFSIILAIFIVVGWPLTNYWLLKSVVILNIFFDGVMLFGFHKGVEEEIEAI